MISITFSKCRINQTVKLLLSRGRLRPIRCANSRIEIAHKPSQLGSEPRCNPADPSLSKDIVMIDFERHPHAQKRNRRYCNACIGVVV